MSLFDLQDVCMAIGSLETLDLPMVVDLIGIYGLKGPYCTLTTTNWFLQALSVIPRGSWRDVSRRFTMIRWAKRYCCANFWKHGALILYPVYQLLIDQRALDLLSAAHQEAVRNLLRQMSAHGLKWTRPVSSMLFEEPNLERGFYIPRNHKSIFFTCWLIYLRKIEGSWVVEEGFDRLVCKCTKCVSSNWPSLPVRVYVTDLSPICLFFKPVQGMDSQLPPAKSWGWYRVCTEVLRCSMFGCLKPIGSFTVCTDIVPIGPVMGDFSIPRRVVDNVSYRIQILDSALPDFSAQISPVVDFTLAPADFVLSSPHQSSSSASSMHLQMTFFREIVLSIYSGISAVGVFVRIQQMRVLLRIGKRQRFDKLERRRWSAQFRISR
ncbi:adoMet-dependent rRNA methyltransferase spb1 [Dorcoceras hygrometricum]|uniref:AdoMet-dependent rRNA methyltransferase spb1 n=1 Tax=Dorcoceras hygrometricum TaxID=472368 RepID=A0A2Z7CW92_9LAMI|nr:adoMet-dependent rRNA methyltransferase spb1 [Dorcoceras hygrometricum]